MDNSAVEKMVINQLYKWGESHPLVRAMLLTSTRAVPGAAVDILSDYDVILVVLDVQPFFQHRAWLDDFGNVLALYRDPLEVFYGFPKAGYVVQFEDGLKIDFNIWSVSSLQALTAEPLLLPELDAGYQVLLDKDHLTEGFKLPTYSAYIPKPPSESEYQEVIEVFFLEAIYVAKYLWREDLVAAKYVLDQFMKQEHLRPLLEWRLEIDHHWMVKPGLYGRGLKKWLRQDLWDDLINTYTGVGLEESWEALYKTITLMRKTALEVGAKLGFIYPEDLEQRTLAYLQKVKTLGKSLESSC